MRIGWQIFGVCLVGLGGCGDAATASTAGSTTGAGDDGPGHTASSVDPPPTSGEGGTAATGDSGASDDSGAPMPGLRCGGGGEEAIDPVDFDALWASFDASGIPRWTTPIPEGSLCSDMPVEGLMSALVIRNDALAQPRSFVPGSARWVVWSNAALACDDPLDAPLCTGTWRAAFAVSQAQWCGVRTGGWFVKYTSDAFDPLFFEVGGAGCEAERFMLSVDSLAFMGLDGADDPPPGQPQAGRFCGLGPLPGLELSPAGEFTAQICGV